MQRTPWSRREIIAGSAVIGSAMLGCGQQAHAAGIARAAPARPAVSPAPPTQPPMAPGATGERVRILQRRLSALGYWCGDADGVFGASTTQAVLALQKVAGLERDGIVGAVTQGALGRGGRPKSVRGGNRIEVDKARQLVLVVRGGAVTLTFNTSTGNGEPFVYAGRRTKALTPSGEFRIFRRVAQGWRHGELGALWRPYYFNGGIALHGATDVPAYPASHGCCRLSIPAQNFLIDTGLLSVGQRVSVY